MLYGIPRSRILINIFKTRSKLIKIKIIIAAKPKPPPSKILLIIIKLTASKNLYYNIRNN